MSHDYHAKNGLPDKVVGDFSDHKDKILADNDDNNFNNNDDNAIQFIFQSITSKNSTVHIQIVLMLVTTKWLRTLTIGIFWTNKK